MGYVCRHIADRAPNNVPCDWLSRVCGYLGLSDGRNAETINDLIKEVYVPTMTGVELEGVKYDPPKPLEWYPGQLAWEVGAPKRVVRKQPAFKTFQRFLVGETGVVGVRVYYR